MLNDNVSGYLKHHRVFISDYFLFFPFYFLFLRYSIFLANFVCLINLTLLEEIMRWLLQFITFINISENYAIEMTREFRKRR